MWAMAIVSAAWAAAPGLDPAFPYEEMHAELRAVAVRLAEGCAEADWLGPEGCMEVAERTSTARMGEARELLRAGEVEAGRALARRASDELDLGISWRAQQQTERVLVQQAERELQDILDLEVTAATPSPAWLVRVAEESAWVRAQADTLSGDHVEAKRSLAGVIEVHPDSRYAPLARLLLAEIAASEGQCGPAEIAVTATALSDGPVSGYAHLTRARCLASTGAEGAERSLSLAREVCRVGCGAALVAALGGVDGPREPPDWPLEPQADCPEGSARFGEEGDRLWCARPDGLPHGPSTVWSAEGEVLLEGSWFHGVRYGQWTQRGEDGALVWQGALIEGQLEGWVSWPPWSLQLTAEQRDITWGPARRSLYVDGVEVERVQRGEAGCPDFVLRWEDGLLHGELGHVREVWGCAYLRMSYEHGERHGEWFVKGGGGRYERGLRQGAWQLCDGPARDLRTTTAALSGRSAPRCVTVSFVDDVQHGPWMQLDPLWFTEGRFCEGQPCGVQRSRWADGSLRHRGRWKNGLRSGRWVLRESDGERLVARYREGELHGVARHTGGWEGRQRSRFDRGVCVAGDCGTLNPHRGREIWREETLSRGFPTPSE